MGQNVVYGSILAPGYSQPSYEESVIIFATDHLVQQRSQTLRDRRHQQPCLRAQENLRKEENEAGGEDESRLPD